MTTKTTKALPWYKTGKGLSNAGIGIVFAIAVYISADHIIHVALHNGQMPNTAYPLPGILDIFGLFCAIKRRASTSDIQRKLNATGMWGVLLISLWFNIEFALMTNTALSGFALAKAVFISAIPALIITLAAEILTHVRKTPATRKPAAKPKAPAKAPESAPKATTPSTPRAPRQRKAPAAESLSAPIAA